MKRTAAIALPVIYAAAVYLATRPPKPIYTLADKTVITVTEQQGPVALHSQEAEYPAQALRERVEGKVKVSVTIAEDGRVANAVCVSGPELLRQAAIDAVRGWQFEPKATETEVEIPFSLGSAHRSIVAPVVVRRTAVTGEMRGSVRVVALVAPDGRVEFARAFAGPRELLPAAEASVRQWIFRPMLRDGKADRGTVVVDVAVGR